MVVISLACQDIGSQINPKQWQNFFIHPGMSLDLTQPQKWVLHCCQKCLAFVWERNGHGEGNTHLIMPWPKLCDSLTLHTHTAVCAMKLSSHFSIICTMLILSEHLLWIVSNYETDHPTRLYKRSCHLPI